MRHRFGAGPLIGLAAALSVSGATPGSAYQFYRLSPDRLISTSREAHRWEPEQFPLHFRIIRNQYVPEGLADEWEAIARDAMRQWASLPTATLEFTVEVVTDDEFIPRIDEYNDIAFADRFGDSGTRGVASPWFLYGPWEEHPPQFTECDVFLNSNSEAANAKQRDTIGRVLVHEIGHCLGLLHTDSYPMATRPDPPPPPGFLPVPLMGYGSPRGALTEDDRVGVSLLYPTREFERSRGAVGGRLVREGTPIPFAYVQAVTNGGANPRAGPGVYADEDGIFLIEGVHPGPTLLWIHPMMTRNAIANSHIHKLAAEAGVLQFPDVWRVAFVEAGSTTVVTDIEILPVEGVIR